MTSNDTNTNVNESDDLNDLLLPDDMKNTIKGFVNNFIDMDDDKIDNVFDRLNNYSKLTKKMKQVENQFTEDFKNGIIDKKDAVPAIANIMNDKIKAIFDVFALGEYDPENNMKSSLETQLNGFIEQFKIATQNVDEPPTNVDEPPTNVDEPTTNVS